jgi:hypothetical protein
VIEKGWYSFLSNCSMLLYTGPASVLSIVPH